MHTQTAEESYTEASLASVRDLNTALTSASSSDLLCWFLSKYRALLVVNRRRSSI